ncbi:hypothetical protein O9993_09770 [Vibrio lentus]|nr:hypothetical protein [Vibrio lentus]
MSLKFVILPPLTAYCWCSQYILTSEPACQMNSDASPHFVWQFYYLIGGSRYRWQGALLATAVNSVA